MPIRATGLPRLAPTDVATDVSDHGTERGPHPNPPPQAGEGVRRALFSTLPGLRGREGWGQSTEEIQGASGGRVGAFLAPSSAPSTGSTGRPRAVSRRVGAGHRKAGRDPGAFRAGPRAASGALVPAVAVRAAAAAGLGAQTRSQHLRVLGARPPPEGAAPSGPPIRRGES